jgi:hypothetical protein
MGRGPGRVACGSSVAELSCGSESVSLGAQSTTREPDQEGNVNSRSLKNLISLTPEDLELTFPSWSGWLRLAWVPRETNSSGPKIA